MKRFLTEHTEFFRQVRDTFHTTGAVAPSSSFVARALTRPMERHNGPKRILEVGPGTGSITRRIVTLLRPEDRLDTVELNDKFVDVLRHRLQHEPDFVRVADRVGVHHMAIQDFKADAPYDYIISGLPINNFTADLVREMFGVMFNLLAPEGVLTYFEYIYMRKVKKNLSTGARRDRLTKLDALMEELCAKHRFHRDSVLINVPPAWANHLRHVKTPA
ncbi:MAG: class I SAM-dependent methyltransferase [Planctomycetaceae bacterium]|jgi:phosphatidylethanolamine/phosphatidyl-N-methylethanolamine N-methyltransferase